MVYIPVLTSFLLSRIIAAFFLSHLTFHLLSFHLTYHPSYLLHLTVSIFISSFCTKRRSIGGGKRGEQEKERGQGLHFVILLFCVSKACSPAWLPCELFCEGARRRSPRAVKHCSLFSVVASHEERYSREEESFQFTLELCLCLHNCAYLLWEEPCQCALNFNISSLI